MCTDDNIEWKVEMVMFEVYGCSDYVCNVCKTGMKQDFSAGNLVAGCLKNALGRSRTDST